jgi:hypothetical protein
MVRVRVLLAALVFGVMFLGVYAAKAHAYDHWIIRNLKTGKCLADMGEPVPDPYLPSSISCWAPFDDSVRWTRSGMGNGGYRFQNAHTHRCLDYNAHDGMRTFPCHPAYDPYAAFQSWSTNSAGSSYRFRLQAFVGRGCIADYSTGLNMSGCASTTSPSYANQVWVHSAW